MDIDMSTILISVLVIGFSGMALGFGLSFASKKLKVEEDPRIAEVQDVLPGANCAACGFPGCANFAGAVVKGTVSPNSCPVGGSALAQQIAKILGIEVQETARMVAYIHCDGSNDKAENRYEYHGMGDCFAAKQLAGGGAKACSYGCLGEGSCKTVCAFDAVVIEGGIARIDNDKCVACSKCIPACPKNLISLVPHASKVRIACNSQDDGKTVKANCKVGCIGCRLCVKACGDTAAVNMDGKLAVIDYAKCTDCGACASKCPAKCIAGKPVDVEKVEG